MHKPTPHDIVIETRLPGDGSLDVKMVLGVLRWWGPERSSRAARQLPDADVLWSTWAAGRLARLRWLASKAKYTRWARRDL